MHHLGEKSKRYHRGRARALMVKCAKDFPDFYKLVRILLELSESAPTVNPLFSYSCEFSATTDEQIFIRGTAQQNGFSEH